MKNPIPQYTFYKTKYGSELLIDVVELKYIKRFLSENPIHTLTSYDITFITEDSLRRVFFSAGGNTELGYESYNKRLCADF